MAVPKKRTGHSAQGSRRANWKATKPETAKCPNCGATVLAHTVCTECGTYKGKPVRLADKAAAAVKPVKKAAKKSVEKPVEAEAKVDVKETAVEEKAVKETKTKKTTVKKSTKTTATKTTKAKKAVKENKDEKAE